ncbi:MAG: hypothetical protein ABI652_01875, partial [Acidobacteriota bacterium]
MNGCRVAAIALVLAVLSVAPLAAQSPAPGSTYRVFLKNGQVLPSYGEPAQADGRVVFNLLIRAAPDHADLQLMSLSSTSVDVERTLRYTETMRAAYYAATRGETDYASMTADAAQTLALLKTVTDRRAQLQMVEQARRRLLSWSQQNFHYREKDVQELVSLFDELVSEMRVAAGESAFAIDLIAASTMPRREALLGDPTLRESVAAALAAALAADVGEERVAILRAAAAAVANDATAADLRDTVNRQLAIELQANTAYDTLARDLTRRADAAMKLSDVAAMTQLTSELAERDRQLGFRRPETVRSLMQQLQTKLEAARVQRLSVEHYAYVRRLMVDYEKQIRPALTALDGLTPVLEYIRDMRSMAFDRVENATIRLSSFVTSASALAVPDDLSNVHATIVSALQMAREATVRRRLAIVTNNTVTDREASSAAAGALLLAAQARRDLT